MSQTKSTIPRELREHGLAAVHPYPLCANEDSHIVGRFDAGIGGGMMLNRLLQPRIEEVAMKLIGGDADDMFYLMNKVEVDQVGDSLAATQVPAIP